jgi:hypothetical protein
MMYAYAILLVLAFSAVALAQGDPGDDSPFSPGDDSPVNPGGIDTVSSSRAPSTTSTSSSTRISTSNVAVTSSSACTSTSSAPAAVPNTPTYIYTFEYSAASTAPSPASYAPSVTDDKDSTNGIEEGGFITPNSAVNDVVADGCAVFLAGSAIAAGALYQMV